MYYVITDKKVLSARNLKHFSKKYDMRLEQQDFVSCGSDFVSKMTDKDIEISIDAKRLSLIPIGALFKKDKGQLVPFIILILLQLIALGK